MENHNKRAIIVGASSGIGLETAKLLLTKNYDVINISRTPAPENVAVCNIMADASVEGSLFSALTEAAAWGKIDVLVYSAGYSMASPVECALSADYRYLFEVNFFGVLEAMRAVIPVMKPQGGGRIVLISSMAATFPVAFDAFYSSSKAAVDMLARSADIELRPYNIRVSSVKPGGVSTKFTFKRKIYGDDQIQGYANKQHKAVSSLAEMEQNGMEAEKVAQTVCSVISSINPPTVTASGASNKANLAIAKVMPLRVISYINNVRYDQ